MGDRISYFTHLKLNVIINWTVRQDLSERILLNSPPEFRQRKAEDQAVLTKISRQKSQEARYYERL